MKLNLTEVTLHYHQMGAGPPLIMLHGNGEDHRIFDPLAKVMAQSYTVYQIDSRNHGQSSRTETYHYATMAQDIAQFIIALELKDVTLLGFSDGAIIAVLLQQMGTLSLATLVLLGLNLSPADFNPAVYQEIQAEYEASGHPLTRLMLCEPAIPLSSLAQITIPTLVVAGETDVCQPAFFQRVAHTLPRGELLVMPGHDHSSYIVNSDSLAGPLLAFLKD